MPSLLNKRSALILTAALAAACLAGCADSPPAVSVSLEQRPASSEVQSLPAPTYQAAQSAPQLPAAESDAAASSSVSFAYYEAGAFSQGKPQGVYLELYNDQTGLYTADGSSVARPVVWHYDGENIVLNFDAQDESSPYLVSLRAEDENNLTMTRDNEKITLRRCTLSGEWAAPAQSDESMAQGQ